MDESTSPPRSEPDAKSQPTTQKHLAKSEDFSAQFGAEGLSLKMALPKWAKTVIAILLAVGFLESVVVIKAIEIHDRYEQSQIAHDRLVKELTAQVQKAEAETQAAINSRTMAYHFNENPVDRATVPLPHDRRLTIAVFANSDIVLVRSSPNTPDVLNWLPAPNASN
jgi:hypothetical protein